jgi:plastocyanin
MKTLYLSIMITVAALFVLISNTGFVAAPLIGKSVEQLLQESDIIVLGTIVSLHEFPSEQMTEYVIKPQEFLKPSSYAETEKSIVAQGLGTKNFSLLYYRTYDIGDHALFFLNRQGVSYAISPYSYVTKSNCSAAQLLDIAGFNQPLFSFSQGSNTDKFYTNEPIDVTTYAGSEPDLKPSDSEIKFRVYTPTGNILTETRYVHVEECKGLAKSSWSFTPTVPGSYSISVTWYGKNETFGGEAMSGFTIINRNGSSSTNFISVPHMIANTTGMLIDIPKGSSQIGCETNSSCYKPDKVTIAQGTKITWHNDDVFPHTVTSGQPSDSLTGTLFDSSFIHSGQSFKFVFNDTGSYDYYCQLHPWMAGNIIVTNGTMQYAQHMSHQIVSSCYGYGCGYNSTSLDEALQEKRQEDLQQAKNLGNAIILSEVGIPIAAGISVCTFLFARKKK